MNKQQFIEKWNEEYGFSVSDVLLRINSNLSDFQSGTLQDLNGLKEYISDYRVMLKQEEMEKLHREQERQEFYDHLGRY
jgi:hypothetical protein